jgi:hypothetical protein
MTCAGSTIRPEYKAEDGANVNQAESYFSRCGAPRLASIIGLAVNISTNTNEMAWREDHRRKPNGTNWRLATSAALVLAKSRVWCGYWQRAAA